MACFEPSMVGVFPDDTRRHKIASFIQLNTSVCANDTAGIAVEDNTNPICKV